MQAKEQEIVNENLGVNWVPGDTFVSDSRGRIWLGDDHPLASLDNSSLTNAEMLECVAAHATLCPAAGEAVEPPHRGWRRDTSPGGLL